MYHNSVLWRLNTGVLNVHPIVAAKNAYVDTFSHARMTVKLGRYIPGSCGVCAI